MNIPVLIVACIMAAAVVAHVFGGTGDTARLAPDDASAELIRYWVQAMCAFQMLSVDLLVVALLLYGIALWDFGAIEELILKAIIGLFCLWGIVWIVQIRWLKRVDAGLFRLPHWMVWFACAGILCFGL